MPLGVTDRIVWGGAQDVIFQRPKDVRRGRPQDVDRGLPLALHRGPYGDFSRTSFWDVTRTSQDVILPSGYSSLSKTDLNQQNNFERLVFFRNGVT